MTDLPMHQNQKETQEEKKKTQAQQDYESGQEFLKNKDLSQAANAFHNSLMEYEQEKNKNGIANASDKLGDICAQKGDFKKALDHYDRAYKICEKHFDRFSLFSIEKKKAKLMYDAKEYDKAISMYLDVLDEYSALLNPQGSVDTLEILAEIYLEKGDRDKAADAYTMAASIHRKFKHQRHASKFEEKARAALEG
jgi:tetratricopeptide (TPR) repeat protein